MLKSRPASFRSGFTLVELLVAMAILAIMVAALGTIMGSASKITTTNDNHIDTNARARTVFDRMANDFAQMVKRSDVDFIFSKATGNDTIFFYTEGASYYDGANPGTPDFKNRVSLVGYRVNSLNTAATYGQLERLGKALMWDAGGNNSPSEVFLNYPIPAGGSCAAFSLSTLAGGTLSGPAVGDPPDFNDSTDTNYHPLSSNVFRFEYSFQLKDGTQSAIPVLQAATAANPNLVPNFTTAGAPPTSTNDFSHGFLPGSRWYDSANQIGYICVDASPLVSGKAVWHEIGIQDISAVVVTLAVIDDQGLTLLNSKGKYLSNLASLLKDYNPTETVLPPMTTTGNPAYLLDPKNTDSWAYALLPGQTVGTVLPQAIVSQIRVYQRFFYINNT